MNTTPQLRSPSEYTSQLERNLIYSTWKKNKQKPKCEVVKDKVGKDMVSNLTGKNAHIFFFPSIKFPRIVEVKKDLLRSSS